MMMQSLFQFNSYTTANDIVSFRESEETQLGAVITSDVSSAIGTTISATSSTK